MEAARQPLIVVFEDIHWAENAFLDLIEHVAATSTGVPLLLLCAARPDLLERRADWLQDERRLIELKPLSDDESALIARYLLGDAAIPDEARDRIVAAAEGNPLFVEQLLSMLIDDGLLKQEAGRWIPAGDLSELAIPPTIQALLSARLDLLGAGACLLQRSESLLRLLQFLPQLRLHLLALHQFGFQFAKITHG